MDISTAWAYGRSQLTSSPTPDLDARLLLQHVLQRSHSYLVAHGSELLTTDQETTYRALLRRAARGEPVPYLVGHAPFFDLEFVVNTAVLIPRPETEQLVEMALEWAADRRSELVVDVGAGSGCIAVMLARRLPTAPVIATDISPDALAVARQNAARHAPGRIQFCRGYLLAPVSGPLDIIVANLPYVTAEEWTMLDDGVKLYEPAIALQGGADGLDLIRQLLQQATTRLAPDGALFLEIGWQQGPAALQAARAAFPAAQVELVADFAGHDRFVVVQTG